MTADWKEPEKLAESLIVDSDSNDEAALDAETSQVSETPGLQPGDIFAGHYEILGVLGHGGMSTVYKAKHLLVNSVRAIKVIRSEQADNAKVLRRFQQEGQAALTLEHPNIGRVYEFGIEPTLQKPFLIMDFVEGKTLAATLAEDGALDAERAGRLIAQVCDGLQEAHTKGVIHRDIKPGNIILTKDANGSEVAKIVDFGIAKLIGRESEQNLRCLPLRGLKKVRLSISMTKGDGDTELDSTGYRTYIISGQGKSGYPDFLPAVRARLRKLKVSDELSLEEHKSNLPEVCIYATLATETAPELSSVALLVKQQVTPVGNPAQIYRIVTFQVERFGKDVPDGGKNPESILKLVLDRFEYYWRLANEPGFGSTPQQ